MWELPNARKEAPANSVAKSMDDWVLARDDVPVARVLYVA
jgi:hypothetical protein